MSLEAEKRAEEHQRRENQILDAAGQLLIRYGFRKTTIDDVAREAGVGKGTVYLHWKDKNELFRAALWRASQHAIDDMLERLKTDPDGGQFHRLFAHGMVAIFANPLLSALMIGKTDIFQGLIGSFDPQMLNNMLGNSTTQIAHLQESGLLRKDLSVNLIVFLIGALKTGIITASEFIPDEQVPSTTELTDALGDLMRRWLAPDEGAPSSDEGKRIIAEWMNELMKIATAEQKTEE